MKSLDYSKTDVPSDYKCKCGATGCKLWREWNTFAPQLLCVDCACTDQKKTNNVEEDGMRIDAHKMRTDQIGYYAPAVPTPGNEAYWGYSSVPDAGCAWWTRLPLRPQDATTPVATSATS